MESLSDQSVNALLSKSSDSALNPATNDLPLEFNPCEGNSSRSITVHASENLHKEVTNGRKRKQLPRDRNDESNLTTQAENSNVQEGSSWNMMSMMTPNVTSNVMSVMSSMPTDPSMLAMVGIPNFNQFTFMDASLTGVAPIMSPMPVKETIHCTDCTLLPPSQNTTGYGPTHKRPLGCKTVFVGGLPENAAEVMMREIFERCGPINVIRMSKKRFCHIRFEGEECVDNALLLSGYRMCINAEGKKSWRLHVDYAEAREDQYEWECNQRALQREMRHQVRIELDKLRPPSPPQVVHYTENEAMRVIEKLRIAKGCNNSLSEAINIVTNWMERGECKKKSAGMFYSLIQGTNSHVRRLINERGEHEEQLNKARQLFNDQMNNFITRFDEIEKVFKAACCQKVWDHFTKAQRKNIETWRKQMQEAKKAHLDQIWNEHGEAEMELSDEETEEPPTKQFSPDPSACNQYSQMKEDNDILKCQNEAYKNEIDLNQTTFKMEIESKDKQIKLLQQALQGMQQQLVKLKEGQSPSVPENQDSGEDDVVLLSSQTESKQNDSNALNHAHNNISTASSTSSSTENSLNEDHIRLLGYLSSFLLVHPCGASLEYIWSYLQSQNLVSTLVLPDIENFMVKFPNVFKQHFSGVGAKIERKWTFQQNHIDSSKS